jgi:hypothetical protein
MAELIATVTGMRMDEAGRLVEQVQVPASGLVEVLHGKRVVRGVFTMREEILALLLSYYPDPVQPREIVESLERRSAGSVRNALGQMWNEKILHRVEGAGYVLTKQRTTGRARNRKHLRRVSLALQTPVQTNGA